MCDLISRSALIEEFRKSYCGHLGMENSDSMMSFKSICRKINNAPIVEARPVLYGEWIKEIGDIHSSGEFVYCSNCGNATFIPSKRILSTTNFRHFEKPNFCPNCGADMKSKMEG